VGHCTLISLDVVRKASKFQPIASHLTDGYRAKQNRNGEPLSSTDSSAVTGYYRFRQYVYLEFSFLIRIMAGGFQLGPLGTSAINSPIVPAPGEYEDGEFGGMMIVKGNRSTRRKSAAVPLCPPQTPHDARMRTRAAAVGSQRLTAWATVQPTSGITW
jgi:hypothetical protein